MTLMANPTITIVGIGPGSYEDITPAAAEAIRNADVIVGYKYYFQFINGIKGEHAQCVDTGMKKETERAEEAFRLAGEGMNVVVISSGDSSIYGMAPLMESMNALQGRGFNLRVVPGISAFQKAASLLGAPIGHDLCIVSLSDLLTPWQVIEKRIRAAAMGDFVTAVYNPRSHGRYWQLDRLREIFLEEGRSADTPVGIVRQAGREEQSIELTSLADLDTSRVDMLSVLIIGNSQTFVSGGRMITPRGYKIKEESTESVDPRNVGQGIMNESFHTILPMLKHEWPTGHRWALLHAIHTTADFEMEDILRSDHKAVERMYEAMASHSIDTIITDVTMAASGIRKAACERLGLEVKCYLSDPRTSEMAKSEGITRTQAGVRLAAAEHPCGAMYVFGNAPTALMELCDLIRKGKVKPEGIIAAPVGFVHVCESKHMVKPFTDIPKIIVEGRKGGSNLAATLVNAIMTYPDAEAINPGRDV